MPRKFRHHKIKREHHVLEALEAGLAVLADLPQVDAVIPGPITRKRGPSTGFSVQYQTPTGLKLLGRSPGAVQEVFVVTKAPDQVTGVLADRGLLATR
jgi:hypothetical protein